MSITFNGSSNGLELAANLFGATPFPIAIFAWFRPRGGSLTTPAAVVSSGRFGASTELSLLTINGTSVRAQSLQNAGGAANFAARNKTLSDAWFCAMAVFNSDASRSIRVNGETQADSFEANNPFDAGSHDRFRIGVRGFENGLYFNGDIAEVAVWQGTLPDATDFAALAAGALPETIKSGSLIWHRQLLVHTDLSSGAAGATPTAIGTLSTGATHPVTRGPAAPVITANPSNQSVTQPATATFTATYTGTITGHQWQFSTDGGSSWNNVTDGTGASGGAGTGATLNYTTTATAVSSGNHRNGYRYRCRLTHSGGTVDSSAAILTVAAPPLSVTLVDLLDESGNIRPSYTVDRIWAIRISDNALVATWSGQTTNASGDLTLSSAALTAVPHVFATYTATGLRAGGKVYTPA